MIPLTNGSPKVSELGLEPEPLVGGLSPELEPLVPEPFSPEVEPLEPELFSVGAPLLDSPDPEPELLVPCPEPELLEPEPPVPEPAPEPDDGEEGLGGAAL
ncbi:MAG TPA: hypothetical protein VK756_01870 [Solirubrobacteraceae bacterium]|nr:hypothetical protein [Solirubrobacteraceae bacterium]